MDPFRLKLRSCHYGNSQWDKCYTTGLSMRCGDGLIHSTKRHKDNQSERLNHLYKTKFTNIFDDKLRAPKSYGAVAFFYPRPVLAFGYCRCLRLCVCVCLSVNHVFVRAITRDPFELRSPNLDRRCKRPWLRSLFFVDWSTLTFKVKFNLKVQIYPILSLSTS